MISLWMDEDADEASEEMKKSAEKKKTAKSSPCACGRSVCCGKHKNGQCACQKKEGRVRD